ncbi:GntR family transcriptional regulator [Curtobacterium sp. MCLR17_054]|uniref:GntR family transcriptional regulator n=1 Tax=Curtobacterium sp. MCLR17_054 TaxID=2175632 RepID=UPI0021ABCA29|nr:GntR family transcriptional regulator [Curtobacterium sp. MCLR17_054]WIE70339.1 GntR family transcriptional regulator [Curtobacterium sp. MCLR17_054]
MPRRLLREVAVDRIRDAILDGTLEPGEPLPDDELAQWLGMSRTPIREALALLAVIGLVDIQANRITRVACRSDRALDEAARFLECLHALALDWAPPLLTAAHRDRLIDAGEELLVKVRAHDPVVHREMLELFGILARHCGNSPLIGTESSIRQRVIFLAGQPREFNWGCLEQKIIRLRARLAVPGSSGIVPMVPGDGGWRGVGACFLPECGGVCHGLNLRAAGRGGAGAECVQPPEAR